MDKQLAQLETVLVDMATAHERLLAVVNRKRQALGAADPRALAACCEEENQIVQAIGELEKQRLTLVAELTLRTDPSAAAPLRLGELAQRLPEPARGRLLVLRQQLRQRIEDVRHHTAVTRTATESLVRHMAGLVQVVGGMVTGIGLYGRGGAAPKAALTVSTFNTTV